MPLRLISSILFFLISVSVYGSGLDSLAFIESVKQFAYKEAEVDSVPKFYNEWSESVKPYHYIYCSEPDRVEIPDFFKKTFLYAGNDDGMAKLIEDDLNAKGCHVFCYKTYANSAAIINRRFLSYTEDARAFIILHEFVHKFIQLKKINIPYEFNEAVADVIGNYGSIEYVSLTNPELLDSFRNQIESNEKIYELINQSIAEIQSAPEKAFSINQECHQKLQTILSKCNSFQLDRFDYKVNNAFLLKNKYYSQYYFLLKKVYEKQGSIREVFKIILGMPDEVGECEEYLEKFI